jgi:hypothetical protein
LTPTFLDKNKDLPKDVEPKTNDRFYVTDNGRFLSGEAEGRDPSIPATLLPASLLQTPESQTPEDPLFAGPFIGDSLDFVTADFKVWCLREKKYDPVRVVETDADVEVIRALERVDLLLTLLPHFVQTLGVRNSFLRYMPCDAVPAALAHIAALSATSQGTAAQGTTAQGTTLPARPKSAASSLSAPLPAAEYAAMPWLMLKRRFQARDPAAMAHVRSEMVAPRADALRTLVSTRLHSCVADSPAMLKEYVAVRKRWRLQSYNPACRITTGGDGKTGKSGCLESATGGPAALLAELTNCPALHSMEDSVLNPVLKAYAAWGRLSAGLDAV